MTEILTILLIIAAAFVTPLFLPVWICILVLITKLFYISKLPSPKLRNKDTVSLANVKFSPRSITD